MDKKNITILCKVVDNFGDIGFVYRLARALSELDDSVHIRLIVSDLTSFAALAPRVDANKSEQTCYGWQIFDWAAAEVCTRAFTQQPPAIILECFQCGRPEWLETLLFDKKNEPSGVQPIDTAIVQIIQIDYLTAESYAEDFHLLKSGTRSARIKKINFMPGFTNKTGGLLLDKTTDKKTTNKMRTNPKTDFTVVFFSYERDCLPVVRALTDFQKQTGRHVRVLVAAGKSQTPFLQAWERAGKPFAAEFLSFLPQEQWDSLLYASDWNFVRGEDSLSRACLAGIPFVWQAYPQAEDYQVVKLAALNERLRSYLPAAAFADYDAYTRAYNIKKDTAGALTQVLQWAPALQDGFLRFAKDLVANGNLAAHLLAWISALPAETEKAQAQKQPR